MFHHAPQRSFVLWRNILLLLIFWVLGLLRLALSYYGTRDNLEVWIPAAVRNFDWYGAQTLDYMVTMNVAPVQNLDSLVFYSHHPPLVVWLPSLMTRLVGFHELGIRFVFLIAGMISVTAFYVLVRRAFNVKLAFLGDSVFCF